MSESNDPNQISYSDDMEINHGTGIGTKKKGQNRVGGYTILREIGRGGMGKVFEALQDSLERRVAIKTIINPMGKDNCFAQRLISRP